MIPKTDINPANGQCGLEDDNMTPLPSIALPESPAWRRGQHLKPIHWIAALIVLNIMVAMAMQWSPSLNALGGLFLVMALFLLFPLKQHLRAMKRNKCWKIDEEGFHISKWEKGKEIVVQVPWDEVHTVTLPTFKERVGARRSNFALGELGVHYDPLKRSDKVTFEDLKHKYIRLDEFLPEKDDDYRAFYQELHDRLTALTTAQGARLEEQ